MSNIVDESKFKLLSKYKEAYNKAIMSKDSKISTTAFNEAAEYLDLLIVEIITEEKFNPAHFNFVESAVTFYGYAKNTKAIKKLCENLRKVEGLDDYVAELAKLPLAKLREF